jgi:uncharacterized protein YbbC (DUF1343 family)
MLRKEFHSFVGLHPLPLRHGMTLGELLTMINSEEDQQCDLEVVGMQDWNRNMFFPDTGLPWVLPSPNIPTWESAMLYPGMVLLEGTNISEGRGTTKPFEIFGAPWIDPDRFVRLLSSQGLGGVTFRPVIFQPTFDKYAGRVCGGSQIHITDKDSFRPVKCAVSIILSAAAAYPDRFGWSDPPYEYEKKKMPIDILYGGDELRKFVESAASLDEVTGSWNGGEQEFARKRMQYLLYD